MKRVQPNKQVTLRKVPVDLWMGIKMHAMGMLETVPEFMILAARETMASDRAKAKAERGKS